MLPPLTCISSPRNQTDPFHPCFEANKRCPKSTRLDGPLDDPHRHPQGSGNFRRPAQIQPNEAADREPQQRAEEIHPCPRFPRRAKIMHETGQIDSHEGDNWTITMPMMVRSHRPRLRLSVGEGEGSRPPRPYRRTFSALRRVPPGATWLALEAKQSAQYSNHRRSILKRHGGHRRTETER